jgi:hypothetical protein
MKLIKVILPIIAVLAILLTLRLTGVFGPIDATFAITVELSRNLV